MGKGAGLQNTVTLPLKAVVVHFLYGKPFSSHASDMSAEIPDWSVQWGSSSSVLNYKVSEELS